MSAPEPMPLVEAIEQFKAMSPHAWYDAAPGFTCMEADIMYDLFVALDMPGVATGFLFAHSREDEEGETHYGLAQDGRMPA